MTTPGEDLYNWLYARYRRRSSVSSLPWVDAISEDFEVGGLEELLYESTVIMLLRRLLSNIAWYQRRGDSIGDDRYEERFLTDYLQHSLRFGRRDAKKLGKLVFNAHTASKTSISDSTRKRLTKQHQLAGSRCSICGHTINYDADPNDPRRFSLDHVWPVSLGGTSDEVNLRPTCASCNSSRQNILSEADVHYEHFYLKSDVGDSSFLTELRREFRIAVYIRSNHSCQRCEAASSSAPLFVETRNRGESLNIFNSLAVCGACRRENAIS